MWRAGYTGLSWAKWSWKDRSCSLRIPWAEASILGRDWVCFPKIVSQEKCLTYGQDAQGDHLKSPETSLLKVPLQSSWAVSTSTAPALPCSSFPLFLWPHSSSPRGMTSCILPQGPSRLSALIWLHFTISWPPSSLCFVSLGAFPWITECCRGKTWHSSVSPKFRTQNIINISWMNDWKAVLPQIVKCNFRASLGGLVVRNPPDNTEDMGLIPGRSHMPQGN